jgi:UDP-N-acetylglucosamine acyltransferase
VGGASLVRKNIPPFIKAAREPLTFAGVNSVGLRRRGFSDEEIKTIEDIYRIIYIQNSNVSKALEIVKESIDPSEIRDEIIHFIESSDKGVIRGMI